MSSGRSRSGGIVIFENVHAIEQVSRKRPARTSFLEVAVRGGDDAHVGVPRLVLADLLEGAVLHEAQELGLNTGLDLADLVEEQRAAVRGLDAPLRSRTAPVKAPRRVRRARSSAGPRTGWAVDDDERPGGADCVRGAHARAWFSRCRSRRGAARPHPMRRHAPASRGPAHARRGGVELELREPSGEALPSTSPRRRASARRCTSCSTRSRIWSGGRAWGRSRWFAADRPGRPCRTRRTR